MTATINATIGVVVPPNDLIVQEKACSQQQTIQLKIYPNPPVGSVTLELENDETIDLVRISDMSGRPVLTKHVDELKKVEVNIDFLEAGIYFIMISGKNGQKTVQILKQ